jgi:hypothetical protein
VLLYLPNSLLLLVLVKSGIEIGSTSSSSLSSTIPRARSRSTCPCCGFVVCCARRALDSLSFALTFAVTVRASTWLSMTVLFAMADACFAFVISLRSASNCSSIVAREPRMRFMPSALFTVGSICCIASALGPSFPEVVSLTYCKTGDFLMLGFPGCFRLTCGQAL